VRVFVDEGAPMATLLGTLLAAGPQGGLAAQVPPDYLRRLADAFQRVGWLPPGVAGAAWCRAWSSR
jgi:hypothetical protein